MSQISADELAGSLQRFLSCLQQLGSPPSPQQCWPVTVLATQVTRSLKAAAGRLGGDLTGLRR